MTPPLSRPLLSGAAVNVAARVATLALALAILVVVARQGPTVQGGFALFVAAESALVTLFSGFGLVLARQVSHHGAPPGALLSAVLRAALAVGALAAVALVLLAGLSRTDPYRHLWLLALAAPCLLLVPTASGLWLGQGRMIRLNAPQVAAPALVLAGLGALAWLGLAGTLAVLVAWVAARAVVGLATAWAALRQTGWQPAQAGVWRRHWRFVAIVGATNVVSLMNLRLTLFLVERDGGLAAAGVYSVAVQVAELLWVLSSAVTVSAYHRIGGSDRPAAARLVLQAVRLNLGLALAAAPLLGLAAWWLLPAALGPAYADAVVPLALLLPGVALYAVASSLSAYYTNLRGRPQWSAAIAGLSLLLTLAVALWSIPLWGPRGAALATSLAYAVAMTVALRGFLREQGWTGMALLRAPHGSGAGRQSTPA